MVLALTLLLVALPAPAQQRVPSWTAAELLPLHTSVVVEPAQRTVLPLSSELLAEGGMPRWIKWGLVGGVVTGLYSFAFYGMAGGTPSLSHGEAALVGGAVGFALVGGSVALFDFVCAPDSWSRRNRLCG